MLARTQITGARRATHWFLLVAAALALVLAGCSDDGNDSEESPAPATASATDAATTEGTSTATSTETAATTPDAAGTIEITDDSGETITLEAPASQIVSHSPAATEILFAIGAGDQVVAVDEYSNYPAEVASLPQVGYATPDAEQDLGYEPDLVIFGSQQGDSLDHFRGLDIRVAMLAAPPDIEGVYEHIRLLGTLTGHEEGAESVIAGMEAQMEEVATAIADVEEGPLVFWELTEDLYTVSPNSFIGAALEFLKVRNVAEGVEGDYPQMSSEAIVEADPDVILMADATFVDPATVPQRAGWAEMTAVVEGKIYPVDGDVMSRPGPRITQGIADLARLLYPDRFE